MNEPQTKRKWHPITWVVIAIGILATLLAIAIPSFVRSRNTAAQRACIENLRMIDAGKEQWNSDYIAPGKKHRE